jgi:hypothetical protein
MEAAHGLLELPENGRFFSLSASTRFFFRRFLAGPASFIHPVRDMDMKRLRSMGLGAEVCWL